MRIFALQSLNLRMPLISSQHFPVWVASQMSVWVRPHDLALSRHVWLSVRMSAVVSMSMNQSSNFEESCPSNVGISWSIVVLRLDSFCCTQGVCLCMPEWFCALVLHWTEGGAGWSTMVRFCTLSVSCDISMDVDWGVLDFQFAN